MPVNLYEARAGANKLLTNLAQTEFMRPNLVMRILFPMAFVGQMGGLVPTFKSAYEAQDSPDDRRADGGGFNEIRDEWGSRAYKLTTHGLLYPISSEKMAEAESEGINVASRATDLLMDETAIALEVEQATVAGTAANYASGHTAALGANEKFDATGESAINPGTTLRAGNAVVRSRIGREPNVLVLDDAVFDALAENQFVTDRIKHTGRDSVTLDMIAALYNYQVAVKVDLPDAFTGCALSAYVDQRVISAWRGTGRNDDLMGGFRVPYRVTGGIDRYMPNFGFTYTYNGGTTEPAHPYMTNRNWDENNHRYDWKLKFNRSVEATGVDDSGKIIFGYLHTACLS